MNESAFVSILNTQSSSGISRGKGPGLVWVLCERFLTFFRVFQKLSNEHNFITNLISKRNSHCAYSLHCLQRALVIIVTQTFSLLFATQNPNIYSDMQMSFHSIYPFNFISLLHTCTMRPAKQTTTFILDDVYNDAKNMHHAILSRVLKD